MKFFLPLMILISIAGCSLMPERSNFYGEITKYGIIEPIGNDKKIFSDNHVAGFYSIGDDWVFTKETNIIPLEKGIEFGIEYTVNSVEPVAVLERVVFPGAGLTNPRTGRNNKISEIEVKVDHGLKIQSSYKLTEDWELIPGKWVIIVLHKNRVILKKVFYVSIHNK